jgi:hypothetical protein
MLDETELSPPIFPVPPNVPDVELPDDTPSTEFDELDDIASDDEEDFLDKALEEDSQPCSELEDVVAPELEG